MPKSKKKSLETEIRNYLGLTKNDKTVTEKQKTDVKIKKEKVDEDDLIHEDIMSKRRERNRVQMQRLRATKKYRKQENERNRLYRKKRRQSEEYLLKMREQQRIYMRRMRADENYRNFERHRDKLYKRRKRKDADYLELIRAKDREYRRKMRAKLKMIDTNSDSGSIKEESELVNKIKIERPKRKIKSRVKSTSPEIPESKPSFSEVEFDLFVLQTRSRRAKPMSPKNPPSESGFREIDFDMFVLENMEFIKKPNEFSDENE